MKSDPPLFRLLVINLCLVISITTGEIEYYQDAAPEQSETDVRLKQLERYLELQSRPRFFRRDHTPPHPHPPVYEDDLSYGDPEREILEAVVENPSILDLLENSKQSYINSQPTYNNIEYPRSMSRPYMNVNLKSPSVYEYPKLKLPYPDHRINDNVFLENFPRYRLRPNPEPSDPDNYDKGMGNSWEQLQDKFLGFNKHYKAAPTFEEASERRPKFTYRFDFASRPEELENTFAAKPNDPRYYERTEHVTRREEYPRMIEDDGEDKLQKSAENVRVSEAKDDRIMKLDKTIMKPSINGNSDGISHEIDRIVEIMPEPQRRAEKEPIITFTRSKVNNDVYFIAIVAGCSAAAMFALVLISLTWCRLQRGVKAAADIEYPAYGVTGPNKDVSPSGDQRLAHSAQMYHFQHQKQQIIAMEKSAASRDPGSVSEAESDEENEEGDYTVYECPGLAPAGEVEVKNPMFHEDPTPATPPLAPKGDTSRH